MKHNSNMTLVYAKKRSAILGTYRLETPEKIEKICIFTWKGVGAGEVKGRNCPLPHFEKFLLSPYFLQKFKKRLNL
jgi:hypothetical protein